jgi:hypothetical protein
MHGERAARDTPGKRHGDSCGFYIHQLELERSHNADDHCELFDLPQRSVSSFRRDERHVGNLFRHFGNPLTNLHLYDRDGECQRDRVCGINRPIRGDFGGL